MKHFFLCALSLVLGVSAWAADKPAAKAKFEFREGDRVVFIGGQFMEREQDDSRIETMLTRHLLEYHVMFRNLGWSGDTVDSHLQPNDVARPKYVPNLVENVKTLKPTVIFISYGMMESMQGEAGLADFVKNYNTLLDRLTTAAGGHSRVVMIAPFAHEKLGGLWPDPTEHNRNLKLYVTAMEQIAKERKYWFINLYEQLDASAFSSRHLTDNGVHLNSYGYQAAADEIEKQLGLGTFVSFPKWELRQENQLRPLIRHKNQQWWFHYRPMNSEYVYPGGERYQDELAGVKHPMYDEIKKFAEMAEQDDLAITALKKQILAKEKVAVKQAEPAAAVTPLEMGSPSPAEEKRQFKLAPGIAVNLFAADPMIGKPVQMIFDRKNRLWVATTTLYPQVKPGEMPTDKIVVLEDADNDGVADKTTVFADNLLIPTGVLPFHDGAFVSDDTAIWFLRDTDGDGKADAREVVLSGFGTEDSHHKAHVMRWGPDGRIYFNTGVFLHNNIETAYGVVSMAGRWQAGIWAYDPANGKLDVHLATSIPPNPWGHYWNRWGFDFFIDSSGQQGSSLILPTAGRSSTALPVPGGEGKLSGGEILSGRHLPEEWAGNLISAPFKENRLARWKFSDDGSGYALRQIESLILSTDKTFRPVDHHVGPDGAIYVADWFNPLIGHMQNHFRDTGRDFTHGRIWKITAQGRPTLVAPKLAEASLKELLENLKAPEDYTRNQSRLALMERNAGDVLSALGKWLKKLDPKEPDYEHHRMEALWVYQSLHTVERELVQSLLRSPDYNARAAATVVLRSWAAQLPESLAWLETQVADDDARVRLQAVIALSYIPQKRAMEIAAKVLDKPMDRYSEQALKNTANALRPQWEEALQNGEVLFGGNAAQLGFVLQATTSQAGAKALLTLLKSGKVNLENQPYFAYLVADLGTAEDLTELFRLAQPLSGGAKIQVWASLVKAARERKVVPNIAPETLRAEVTKATGMTKAAALRLAGAWKQEGLRGEMEQAARGTETDGAVSGLAALASLGGDKSRTTLRELTAQAATQGLRLEAISQLAELDLAAAAEAGAERLAEKGAYIDDLLRAFIARKGGTEALAKALAGKTIPADNAKLALRFLLNNGRMDEALLGVLRTAAGSGAETKEMTRDEILKLAAEVTAKGDAHRGEMVYRRTEISCQQCHAIAGAGGLVGPDLSGVGGGSTVDYLLESVLYPNHIIKDGFESVEVTTKDDDYALGILVRENRKELVLKDASRPEIIIPISQIKERVSKKTSLMPGGLTDGLTQQELLDLVKFLSELGRPGPFANNPKPMLRRWKYALPAPANFTPQSADALTWLPAYALVSGELPMQSWEKTGNGVALSTQLDVTTPGKIRLNFLMPPTGMTAWVDGKRFPLEQQVTLELSRQLHTFHFYAPNLASCPLLSVEVQEVEGSAGRFQLPAGP